MIAWDLPAPDEYVDRKAALYTQVDVRWAPFFEDDDATILQRQIDETVEHG